MTLKAHANQSSTVTFLRGQLHGKARRSDAVPQLRRVVRHSEQDAIVLSGTCDVNLNLRGVSPKTTEETEEVYSSALAAIPAVEWEGLLSASTSWEGFSLASALDEEDEDEDEDVDDDDDDDDDDELDEDDEEDLEDEDFDDEDLDEDEDEDLDDDDLDDDDEDDEE